MRKVGIVYKKAIERWAFIGVVPLLNKIDKAALRWSVCNRDPRKGGKEATEGSLCHLLMIALQKPKQQL